MVSTAARTGSRYAEVVLAVFGTYSVVLGLLMLGALRWPRWRVPALAFGTAHWALHALSHVLDTHHADGTWVGWLEAAGLVFATVLLAIALRSSISDDGWR